MSIVEHVPDGTFVQEIAKLVHPRPSVENVPAKGQYLWMAGHQKELMGTPLLPEPEPLQLATLGGIVDAYKARVQGEEKALIQVVSPYEVRLVAPGVGEQKQNFLFARAVYEAPRLNIGSFMGLEEFIVLVQSSFGLSSGRDRVLDFVGGLTAGIAAEIADNGAAQSVVAKRGITRAGAPVEWENPVQLAPFRTFSEVEQPYTAYILRLKQAKNGEELTAQAALFEGDGGAWKTQAVRSIGEWIRAELPDAVVLA